MHSHLPRPAGTTWQLQSVQLIRALCSLPHHPHMGASVTKDANPSLVLKTLGRAPAKHMHIALSLWPATSLYPAAHFAAEVFNSLLYQVQVHLKLWLPLSSLHPGKLAFILCYFRIVLPGRDALTLALLLIKGLAAQQ